MNLFDLTDQVAVVVGGAGDFGSVACRTYASYGAKIVVADLKIENAEKVSDEIRSKGGESIALEVDASDKSSCNQMVSQVIEKFGKIDILFITHGTTLRVPALEIEEEDWDRVMRINLKGVFLVCQAVGKIMTTQKKGNIIIMASAGAYLGIENQGAYSPSKAGVIQLTKVLACEWAKYNIRVNAIAPTAFFTNFTRHLLSDKTIYNKVVQDIPLGKIGQPEEMAPLVLFLASDKAVSMITGQTIRIDGGQTFIRNLYENTKISKSIQMESAIREM